MGRTRYVALLRGINVGGRNPVPMGDLRTAFDPAWSRLALGTRDGVVKRVNPEVLNRDEWEVIGLKDGDEVVGAVELVDQAASNAHAIHSTRAWRIHLKTYDMVFSPVRLRSAASGAAHGPRHIFSASHLQGLGRQIRGQARPEGR